MGAVAGWTSADWDRVTDDLLIRSGGNCEVRSPECIGPELTALSTHQWSRHHRMPRGMGGTSLPADVTHALWNLLIVCGHGTIGCHGYVERNREEAVARGWIVVHGVTSPRDVPVVLWSGRRVMLADTPFYERPVDGGDWMLDAR